MRARRFAVSTVVLGLVVTGVSGVQAEAVDDRCFDPANAMLYRGPPDMTPVVLPLSPHAEYWGTNAGYWPIVVSAPGAQAAATLQVHPKACNDPEFTFTSPTGAVRRVPLPSFTDDLGAPFSGNLGYVSLSLGDAGRWRLTAMKSDGVTRQLATPATFWVLQKVVVQLDHLPPTPVGGSLPISGTVTVFTRNGQQVPFTARNVALTSTNIDGEGGTSLGTVKTDAHGRFKLTVPVQSTRIIRATTADAEPFASDTDTTMAFAGKGIQLTSAYQVPPLGGLTTVKGRTVPGGQSVVLESHYRTYTPDPTQWNSVATVTSGADGRFSITYRSNSTIEQLMRLRINGTSLEDVYETEPAHRTTLTATTGGTHTTVIKAGTKMSSYGRLKVTFDNGLLGNYANQQVVVQTKARGAALFRTVATTRTTSTGYFYTNWTAKQDADVRVAFLSPYRTVQWAFASQRSIDIP